MVTMDDIPLLDCGHSFNPTIGAGRCTWCRKICCAKCLTAINGFLLCPACFANFVRK